MSAMPRPWAAIMLAGALAAGLLLPPGAAAVPIRFVNVVQITQPQCSDTWIWTLTPVMTPPCPGPLLGRIQLTAGDPWWIWITVVHDPATPTSRVVSQERQAVSGLVPFDWAQFDLVFPAGATRLIVASGAEAHIYDFTLVPPADPPVPAPEPTTLVLFGSVLILVGTAWKRWRA